MKEMKQRIGIAVIGLTVGLAGIGCGLMACRKDVKASTAVEQKKVQQRIKPSKSIADLITINKT